MSAAIEIEVTYLAASIPDEIAGCKHTEIKDVYFPAAAEHAKLRIRHAGDSYELTKKTQLDPNDAGQQQEENVALTAEEFAALARGDGRRLHKTRYYVPYNGLIAEIDIFHDDLDGLVIIEFEFDSPEAKAAFVMPDFCLADVTQDDYIAGGMLAGKTYAEIEPKLARFNYQLLHVR